MIENDMTLFAEYLQYPSHDSDENLKQQPFNVTISLLLLSAERTDST